MPDQNQILLQTKLHRPPITRTLLVRPRLLEQLNRGVDCPLTLVSAPAGFGKTTLVSAWLEGKIDGQFAVDAAFPVAWLSLDENDSDLNLFLRYFIAALRTIVADACPETLTLLQAQRQPPHSVLHTTFSNEIEQLSQDFILVLDDYSTLHGVEAHNLLIEFCRHWPKPLHLVLISRMDPPLPLSSLRAKGMLSEIRTRDLRFTAEETAAFLGEAQLAFLSQDDLMFLEERFEGWPAGLHLAVLSLRSAGGQDSVRLALSSKNPNIAAYLVDEVLAHQASAVQSFLLKTSILDHFCTSLCEAVVGDTDTAWNVQACLDWIDRSELFLIHLDNRQEWYRYHHLFQELLQQRLFAGLAPGEVANLHIRASVWFEAQGLLDEALQHALAAGDFDLAAGHMIAGLRDVLNRVDRPTLDRWLRLLPEEMIRQHPELLIIKAWTLHFSWRLDLLPPILLQVEELLDAEAGVSLPPDDLQLLRGQILILGTQLAYFCNQTERAIDLCQQVLALMPLSWTFVRGAAMLYVGLSMQANGQALDAERLLLAEYEAYSDKTEEYALRLLNALGFIYLNTGQLEQCRQIAQLMLRGAILSRIVILVNWSDYFLGMVHYYWDELETAAQHFARIAENPYTSILTVYRDAVAGLALIHQTQGESSEAWQVVESISQFDLEQRGSEDDRTRSLRARLMLLQGDLEGASRWADTLSGLPPNLALVWLEEPQVTRVRVLLARGTPVDLQLSLQILDALDEIADRTHNTRFRITFLALRALVLDALGQDAPGETGPADAVLKQALDLARLGGFIRVFTDLGRPMQAMLHRLAGFDHAAEPVQRILAAFPEDAKNLCGRESPELHPGLASSMLVEPLTPRELEVLALLQGPLSVKEIALKLNITYPTAKRHTINIYGKLGVNRRWNAVTRAEELHILPPR